jgi:hypothetical protein
VCWLLLLLLLLLAAGTLSVLWRHARLPLLPGRQLGRGAMPALLGWLLLRHRLPRSLLLLLLPVLLLMPVLLPLPVEGLSTARVAAAQATPRRLLLLWGQPRSGVAFKLSLHCSLLFSGGDAAKLCMIGAMLANGPCWACRACQRRPWQLCLAWQLALLLLLLAPAFPQAAAGGSRVQAAVQLCPFGLCRRVGQAGRAWLLPACRRCRPRHCRAALCLFTHPQHFGAKRRGGPVALLRAGASAGAGARSSAGAPQLLRCQRAGDHALWRSELQGSLHWASGLPALLMLLPHLWRLRLRRQLAWRGAGHRPEPQRDLLEEPGVDVGVKDVAAGLAAFVLRGACMPQGQTALCTLLYLNSQY